MSQIKVELIDSAGGDISVVNAARVSFGKEVKEMDTKDVALIRYLVRNYHDTPLRHNFIQLRCKVPLFLARQIGKHQSGLTWNEESRRYIDNTPEFYVPKEWRRRPDKSIKQGSGGTHELNDDYISGYDKYLIQCSKVYCNMVTEGVAPEMARMVLPQSMMVNFIWSGNLLAFHHVYKLRAGEGAQQEAVEFAHLLKKAIEPAFPISWEALEARS